jgi:beta-lactamase regulating signal transducer with metallopeptidase domain
MIGDATSGEVLGLAIRAFERAQISANLCILMVLLARRPSWRLMGTDTAYRLWLLPVLVAVSCLFPTLAEFERGRALRTDGLADATLDARLAAIWLAGVLVFSALLVRAHLKFHRQVRAGVAGPAAVGFAWQRLVTPKDFRSRFSPAERALILEHEKTHMAQRDPAANLLICLLQAVFWFDPLVHVAAAAARLDQELACDEAVVRGRGGARRLYAETLMKAQLLAPRSPLVCAFIGAKRHPLEVRLAMLAKPRPGLVRHLSGVAIVALAALLIAASVWAGGAEKPTGPTLAKRVSDMASQLLMPAVR